MRVTALRYSKVQVERYLGTVQYSTLYDSKTDASVCPCVHVFMYALCICMVYFRLPMVRLALVGTGPDADALKDYFKGTKTVLTGIMTGEALSQAFASADVFVMPSDSETLGFVVLESMASGVPVVGADAGGIPDLIDHGKVRGALPLLFSTRYNSTYKLCIKR